MEHLKEKGYECVDYGAYDPNVKVNYPEPGLKVAEAIMRGEVEKGVLICGTGIGISLAANKVPGIRAAEQFIQNCPLGRERSCSILLPLERNKRTYLRTVLREI